MTTAVYGKGGKKKAGAADRVGVFIKVEGEYYSKTVNYCVKKQYSVELQLTDDPDYSLPDQARIRTIAHNKLLPHYFKSRPDQYPDFSNVRTCYLIDVQVFGASSNRSPKSQKAIEDMVMNELVLYAARHDLNTNPRNYPTIQNARKAVRDEIENIKLAKAEMNKAEHEKTVRKEKEFDDVREILEFNGVRSQL